jgi:hypothetical protein
MKARTRTRDKQSSSGRVFYPPSLAGGPYPFQKEFWKCDDFIEKKKDELTGLTPPSSLSLRKGYFKPCFMNYRLTWINGPVEYHTLEYDATNLPCRVFSGLSDPPLGWTYLEGATTNELVAKLLAKSNPFRYDVSIPVMTLELVEAASLLKLASANFVSLIGSAELNRVFGWEATARDIKSLAKITVSIENRIKEFNDLISKGGLRRKVWLARGKGSRPEYEDSIFSNSMGEWKGKVTTWYESEVWGSVRWAPNRASPIDLTKLTAFNEALKIVLDLRSPDASTIWEGIPYSWLLDYFLNVGDTLQALEDTDKVLPYDVCIMRKRTITTKTVGIPVVSNTAPWRRENSFSDGEFIQDVKLREIPSYSHLGDLLSFGIMSKGQASNLIALLMSLARFKK